MEHALRTTRRAIILIFLCICAVGLLSVPAFATFSENTIGCRGSALITDPDGKTYPIDAEDTQVTIPREGSAKWEGSTVPAVHNHSGQVSLDFDLFDVGVGEWGSANDNDEIEASGTTELPAALQWVPPGIYAVAGFHSGDEGSCSGRVEIVLGEGGDPWKYGVLAFTALMFGGFVWAGFVKGV